MKIGGTKYRTWTAFNNNSYFSRKLRKESVDIS